MPKWKITGNVEDVEESDNIASEDKTDEEKTEEEISVSVKLNLPKLKAKITVDDDAEQEGEEKAKSEEDELPLSVIQKKKMFQGLMNEAKERSNSFKSKIISQLYEVFKMFDSDHDGFIDENDLKFTFTSMGETDVSDEKIKAMISESEKPIDFHAFVGLFESKEMEFDPEMELLTAFYKWDTKSNGSLLEETLKQDLQSWGDRFSEKEAGYALEEAPLYEEDEKNTIDYVEFCANICGLQNIRESDLYREYQEKYLNNSTK
ncbi:hypothetical protein TSAR_010753 [Trichomalopsis sarcophagae]|uniref:EF-hand domain-containing protein n=1 Tax=Trichomalopsis sarcophagae TaxID=543379 RepID=A0A232EUR9_9HYME|nr:hypothetical protein TSAR_010753 [Trichomalopsis sarcophagae]